MLEEDSRLVLHEFLVQVAGLRNAKYTCYQGACGACVVAASFKDPVTQAPKTIAFNSVSLFRQSMGGYSCNCGFHQFF